MFLIKYSFAIKSFFNIYAEFISHFIMFYYILFCCILLKLFTSPLIRIDLTFFIIFITVKLFIIFITRSLIRYQYFIVICIICQSWIFMIKNIFFSFNITKHYNFLTHLLYTTKSYNDLLFLAQINIS